MTVDKRSFRDVARADLILQHATAVFLHTKIKYLLLTKNQSAYNDNQKL